MHGRTGDHFYSTGEFFGMVAMLEHDLNHAAFVSATKCRLLKLYREDFHRLEAASPAIAAHIRQVATARHAAYVAQTKA
jgi:voltage-gated potassium channel